MYIIEGILSRLYIGPTVEVTSRQSGLRARTELYANPHNFPGLVHRWVVCRAPPGC
ncbi:hypothetical protein D1AOALGA4SA_1608 [Olavius algarvensis Delta 1 endosymbiont]|nr:hypothetical protein D1AOALGA4SA_1608 [Olavius algarvensis Delta 1 endosymbiont]